MKKAILIFTLLAIAGFFILKFKKDDNHSPQEGYPPGVADINLEDLESDYYRANWLDIREIISALLGMNYMKIKINDFEYQYYCTHCEGIEYQGSDPLIVNPENLAPIHDWCERNSGKFAEVGFYDWVEFRVVTEVVQILNNHGIKFAFSEADRSEQIKIDLLDGRPKVREINESN